MTAGGRIEEAGSAGGTVDVSGTADAGGTATTGGAEDTCAEVLLMPASPIAGHPLTYRVPPALDARAGVGMRALVPLGPRARHGVIVDVHRCCETATRPLRDLLDIPDPRPVFSATLLALARRVADDSVSSLGDAIRCLIPPEVSRRGPVPGAGSAPKTAPAALGPASAPLKPVCEPATLLWGDMEARRRWIADAVAATLRAGRGVILTVPEIALVPHLAAPLRDRWEGRVAEFHSDMPASGRRLSWTRIQAGEVDVVVGTRSALFAPVGRLGLIVVDEEQDASYKAEEAPRYHGRTVALARGELERARVVLGASAPSLEAFAAASDGRARAVHLHPSAQRVPVTIVDMRRERREGRAGILARPLLEAIRRHLRGGGRVALFVNRAGYARVLVCRECGRVVRCPGCEIPMPYDGEARAVRCRVCGTASPAPDVCPRCRGVALRWAGAGTVRVLEVVRRLFPALHTARLDRETARGFDTVAEEFAAGRIRLIVATQLLLRGRRLHPSLVGVVDADTPLYRPDFRAAERAFQDVRAVIDLVASPPAAEGRPGPEAVIQTRLPEHPVITALGTGREIPLYEEELRVRKQFGYPPYAHLVRLIASSRDRETAGGLAARAAAVARSAGVEVLGPASVVPAPGRAPIRVQCLLRSSDADRVRAAARAALEETALPRGSRLVADADPQELS